MGTSKTFLVNFRKKTLLIVLDKRNIKITFTLSHALFIKAFNSTIKNRLVQYMNFLKAKNLG